MRPTLTIATASVAALLTVTGQAQAQLNRTFVSGQGLDTNPCTLALPCRTFTVALGQTNAGGEIAVLDTAGYGAVTIAKSVTITNPGGVEAGISATGNQDAIQIDAATSSINVTLRGLTLQGVSGNNGNGVDWVSGGGTLNVIDCVMKDFGNNCILVNPLANSPALAVTISNTTALNNKNGGIFITPRSSAGAVTYSISHTITNTNGTGISVEADTPVSGSISFVDSEMNTTTGFFLHLNAAGDMTIVNSIFRHNPTDMFNGGTIYLQDSNTIGVLSLGPGAITNSDGTNTIISGGGSLTKVAPQ